ncbi:MAG: outer membrane beta-barrel protein [Magnetospirillum sp.]|nr:outer membrane beta-barrel protein [Magnetospirillum sp.]
MTSLSRLAATASLLSIAALPAMAAEALPGTPDYNSWYAGLDAAFSATSDTAVQGSSQGKIQYDNTVNLGGLKLGYRPEALYSNTGAVRFEAELLGRSASLKSVTQNGVTTKPKGELNMGALMVNAYYDFHTGTAFTPYVGGGIGIAAAEFSDNPGLGITDKKSTDTMMAGQLSVGVAYTPEMWPNTTWNIGYNYFHMDDSQFKTGNGHVTLDAVSVSSLQLGFRYGF